MNGGMGRVAVAGLAACLLLSIAALAAEPNPFVPGDSENAPGKRGATENSGSENSPWKSAKEPDKEAITGPAKDKLVKTLERRLGQMQPVKAKKKSLDDYWVIGTAEVHLASLAADIRFDFKQGQKETAEFLADFILGAPPETARRWHVFARLKSSEEAEQALQMCRRQYDAAQEYRDQMATVYRARTTRRC